MSVLLLKIFLSLVETNQIIYTVQIIIYIYQITINRFIHVKLKIIVNYKYIYFCSLSNPALAALPGDAPVVSLTSPPARAALSGAFAPSTDNVPAQVAATPATSTYPAARFAAADEPADTYAASAFSAPAITIGVPTQGGLTATPTASSYYLPARFAAALAPSAFPDLIAPVNVPVHSNGRFINAFPDPTASPSARFAAAAEPIDDFVSSPFAGAAPSVTVQVPAYAAGKVIDAAPAAAYPTSAYQPARFAAATDPANAFASSLFAGPSVTVQVPAYAAGKIVDATPAAAYHASAYQAARFAAAFAPSAFPGPTSSVNEPVHAAVRFIHSSTAPAANPASRFAAVADAAESYAPSSFSAPNVPAYAAGKVIDAAPVTAAALASPSSDYPAARFAAATDAADFSTPSVSISIPAYPAQTMDSESSPIYSPYAYAPAYSPTGYAPPASSPTIFSCTPYSTAKFVNAAASPVVTYAPAYTSAPAISISTRLFDDQAALAAFTSLPAPNLINAASATAF